MERAKRLVDRVLGVVLIALMGIAVVNVLWQVFTRFVLNDPSAFTEELARFLLIWVGVLGAGYGVGQHDHLALELLPEYLTGRSQQWLKIAIQGFVILFALAVLVGGGLRLAYIQFTLGQTSASLGLPIGYVYLVLPLSGLVMIFYAVSHISGSLRVLREESNPSEPSGASRSPNDE